MAGDTIDAELVAPNVVGDLYAVCRELLTACDDYRLAVFKAAHAIDEAAELDIKLTATIVADAVRLDDRIAAAVAHLDAIAAGIERTGLEPAGTASGGTYRPARCSCGSAGSRGTVESDSTTDATAGLDRSES
jgi:hypothetical protein